MREYRQSHRGIGRRRTDFFRSASHEERGLFGIKLPKIPIGRIIGGVVSKVVPGGSSIVSAVNTGIDIVKGAKLTPEKIVKNVGAAAINAGAAQLSANTSEALTAPGTPGGALQSNTGIVLILAAAVLLLAFRKGGR